VGRDDVKIDAGHARVFAYAIYRDIHTYIQNHQEEYQQYLNEELEGNNGKNTVTYRPKGGDEKTN